MIDRLISRRSVLKGAAALTAGTLLAPLAGALPASAQSQPELAAPAASQERVSTERMGYIKPQLVNRFLNEAHGSHIHSEDLVARIICAIDSLDHYINRLNGSVSVEIGVDEQTELPAGNWLVWTSLTETNHNIMGDHAALIQGVQDFVTDQHFGLYRIATDSPVSLLTPGARAARLAPNLITESGLAGTEIDVAQILSHHADATDQSLDTRIDTAVNRFDGIFEQYHNAIVPVDVQPGTQLTVGEWLMWTNLEGQEVSFQGTRLSQHARVSALCSGDYGFHRVSVLEGDAATIPTHGRAIQIGQVAPALYLPAIHR